MLAHPSDLRHFVVYEDSGPALVYDFFHPLEAFLLKGGISYRQDFIQDDDFRVKTRCNRKRQSDVHPIRIVLNRNVDEFFQSRKVDDLIEPVADFLFGKS
jgi:hypothetical protein